jgi:hypothetical protein
LDPNGLINSILFAVERISLGRKGLATDGMEHEGRLFYEAGITSAAECFNQTKPSA